jgi:hypothetical protein
MCRTQAVHPTSNPDHADGTASGAGIGELFRQWGQAYINTYKPCKQHIKLIKSIQVCRTPAMGGVVMVCKDCGARHYIYKSCGHSHCMLCQSIKREQWMDRLNQRLLKVPYIHTTFTIPHQLNGLFRMNQRALYGALMKACWQTVKVVSSAQGYTPGMTSVLHTFGSDMKYHIHVHALISLGGVDQTGQWQYPHKKNKIASFRVLCSTFKQMMISQIQQLEKTNQLRYHLPVEEMLKEVAKVRWVVHSTRPTMDTTVIQSYLARYINRTAISPSRLKYLPQQHEVHILYNDYKHQQSGLAAPKAIKVISPLEAIHQMLQHVLPLYFNKSRHYGIHRHGTKVRKQISNQLINHSAIIRTVFEILRQLLKIDVFACEYCGSMDFIKDIIAQDDSYLLSYHQNRAPQASLALHAGRSSNPTVHPIAQKGVSHAANPQI